VTTAARAATLRKIFAALHEAQTIRNIHGRRGRECVGGILVSSRMLSNFIAQSAGNPDAHQ
jgi:hypothetical protein